MTVKSEQAARCRAKRLNRTKRIVSSSVKAAAYFEIFFNKKRAHYDHS
ncbi:hypothetical protein K6Y31_04995 [Motilimonas cestriensis]|uniref:Mobile element protein n=1 Tax=Motilimonas cestriensis TaxID=2742685 RepID=A0ABS8W722_9GAMM|nr:hypothetical protein [Motilimonas cestriensis]MCE2594167.1 hypothetical protein [Motilimonas cestriensis]